MNIGTWNVRGLNTKEQEVFEQLQKFQMDVCALTETKKKGKGSETKGNYLHFYSGIAKEKRAKHGVSIAIHKRFRQHIKEIDTVTDRIIRMDLRKVCGKDIVIVAVYAPTDDANIVTKDQFEEDITAVLGKINKRKEIILLGDFNGRVGKKIKDPIVGRHGEEVTNDNGDRLIELCSAFSLKILNGFFPHKNVHKYTWHQPTKNYKSILDYIIIKQSTKLRIQDVRVQRGADCGSDHFLLRGKLLATYTAVKETKTENENKNTKQMKTTIRYNLKSLLDPSIRFLYMLRLSSKLNIKNTMNIEEKYQHIKECIHAAAREALGEEEKNNKKTEWWDKEVERVVKEKEEMYKQWLRTGDSEDRKMYTRINREVKKVVKEKKNQMWERKCSEINRYLGGTRVTEAWKFVKRLRKDTNDSVKITTIETEEWKEYYSKLLKENRDQYKKIDFGMIENNGENVQKVTVQEIQEVLKHIKNGKAGGPGGIPVELVKYGPMQLLEALCDIFNKCIRQNEDVPREWRQGIIFSIYKKGKKNVCENYRGITITSAIGRLYGRIIAKRIEKEIKTPEEQSGFTAGKSCTDNIFILQQLAEKKVMRGREAHLVFIDIKKAYDNVPLKLLFEILEEEISPQYVNAIKNLYKNNISTVRNGDTESQEFQTNKGLRQGCSVSPTLFKIYLNRALKHWNDKCGRMGIHVGENILSNLLFADDQVIIAEDLEDITYMIKNLDEQYEKWGLDINYDKTKYMIVGENKRGDSIQTKKGVIENVNNFKYLGTTLTLDGKSDTDIKVRVGQGRQAINTLNSLWWSKEISRNNKKKLYKSIVEPITTYGCEVWEISKRNENRLKALQMDFARRSCRISRIEHKTNKEIKEKMKIEETIIDGIEKRRLMWYGHVRRMGTDRWPLRVWEWVPKERRKKGRPRNTWKKGVTEAMVNRQIEEETWQDREEWRS